VLLGVVGRLVQRQPTQQQRLQMLLLLTCLWLGLRQLRYKQLQRPLQLQSAPTGVRSAMTLTGTLVWPVPRQQQQGPAAATAVACLTRLRQTGCMLLLLLLLPRPRSKAACLTRLVWGVGMLRLQQQRRRRAATCRIPLEQRQ
jgi:hypothetical protein